jgi:hypothetical protein
MSLRQEYPQITQGYRNAETSIRTLGWSQDVRPKARARCPAKDCETTSATDSSDALLSMTCVLQKTIQHA